MHIADDLIVRAERDGDHCAVDTVLRNAFGHRDVADAVNVARKSKFYNSSFTFVGDLCDEIVAMALLAPVSLGGVARELAHPTSGAVLVELAHPASGVMALATVAVTKAYQHKGIGAVVLKAAIRTAQLRGLSTLVVVGDPAYFGRFGFEPASKVGLTAGFDIDPDTFLALPIKELAQAGVVEYSMPVMGLATLV